jgi:hypothetical protein
MAAYAKRPVSENLIGVPAGEAHDGGGFGDVILREVSVGPYPPISMIPILHFCAPSAQLGEYIAHEQRRLSSHVWPNDVA